MGMRLSTDVLCRDSRDCLALCTGSHLLGGRVMPTWARDLFARVAPPNLNRNLPDARVDSVFVHFLLTISICRRF